MILVNSSICERYCILESKGTIRYLGCFLTVSTSMMSTTTMKTTVMTMHSELLPCYGPKISEHFFFWGGGGGGGGGRVEGGCPRAVGSYAHTSNLTTSNKCHGYCPEMNSCYPSFFLISPGASSV